MNKQAILEIVNVRARIYFNLALFQQQLNLQIVERLNSHVLYTWKKKRIIKLVEKA